MITIYVLELFTNSKINTSLDELMNPKLTLYMWVLSYAGLTRWVLMPWLLALPQNSTHDIEYVE